MNICDECGRVKPEEVYELSFRPKEIPRAIMDEAYELLDDGEKAGRYAGYGGSKHRLLRDGLKEVILNKIRFWEEATYENAEHLENY